MRLPVLAVLALSSTAACEPLSQGFGFDREPVPIFAKTDGPYGWVDDPGALRVMAWNVKYGAARIDFWFDYWGDRVEMTHEEVVGNMEDLYALVNEIQPDVFMAEEIEQNSRRSAYYDMIQGFLDNCPSLNFGAYFQSWDSRYIASEGLGRMDLGNAIFSRYPIKMAERIRQPDRTDQSDLTKTFYIHRMIGHAVLDLGSEDVSAYVVHTEAYDQDGTKQRQLEQIHDEVSADSLPFVLGGDFNELPPTALQLSGFPDESPKAAGGDYEQPPYTPEKMQPFFDDFAPFLALDAYGATEEEQRQYFSHSVIGPDTIGVDGLPGFWNRTLDYLFATAASGGEWASGASDVLQTSGRQGVKGDPRYLSDHAPVVGTWSY